MADTEKQAGDDNVTARAVECLSLYNEQLTRANQKIASLEQQIEASRTKTAAAQDGVRGAVKTACDTLIRTGRVQEAAREQLATALGDHGSALRLLDRLAAQDSERAKSASDTRSLGASGKMPGEASGVRASTAAYYTKLGLPVPQEEQYVDSRRR